MVDRLTLLLAYLKEDPTDAFTRFALAQEYRKRGEHDEAVAYLAGLVRDAPEYVGAYYHLGKLYEELERRDDAIRTYEQGVEMARSQRDYHALSELQDALMHARGVGWDDE